MSVYDRIRNRTKPETKQKVQQQIDFIMKNEFDFELLKNKSCWIELEHLVNTHDGVAVKLLLQEWLSNLQLLINKLEMEKEQDRIAQTSYGKLKELWDEHKQYTLIEFKPWIWVNKLNKEWHSFYLDLDNEQKVDKWLAEYCGFATTAEVRYVLSLYKNS